MLTPDRLLAAEGRRITPRISINVPLTVRTWIGADSGGYAIGFALLAHPPAHWLDAAPADVNHRMRALAFAAGLRPPDQPVADLGTCLTVRGGCVRLRFERLHQGLTLPAHEHWKRLLLTRPEVALVVGLAPLAADATAEEANRYLEHGVRNGYLMLGRVHAEHPMRPSPRHHSVDLMETAARTIDEGKSHD
ncbi:hypothetical protein ABT009_42010 [Streptomyces sp. NPDC002896]|uniref:hypothetical protein n=1 Tax=Streptomyces sp. NPDC002896 TaxID=3154438 RepID=UPI003324259B